MRVVTAGARGVGRTSTGVFTIWHRVQPAPDRKIALYFTGRRCAGENMADLLQHRARPSGPPLKCVTRSRATYRTYRAEWNSAGHCLRTVEDSLWEVAPNFPGECRYVLEMLGQVYGHVRKGA